MSQIKRPSLFLFLTETIRALWELRKVLPFIRNFKATKKGDGHSVFVIPGFLASDLSTSPLRRFLKKLGYEAYGWGKGTNFGNIAQLETLEEKIDDLFQKSGQPISLIGWSLGGIYARELAKRKGEKVRQVITLGSPFNGVDAPNNANVTFKFVQWLKGFPEPSESLLNSLPLPAYQPTTAIYSKKDGIVPWEACQESKEDDFHQNLEVSSSHLGMGVDIKVLKIIADRLQYQKSNWRLFGQNRSLKTKV